MLEVLTKNQLFAKHFKFATAEVEYLGHIVSNEGGQADPKKLETMTNWLGPKNLKALTRFLDLIDYYQKFVKHYGHLATPLTALLKKDAFKWNANAAKVFQKLKTTMMHPPMLALLDFTKGFIIEYDACGVGIGAVMIQNNQPITFLSQSLIGRNLLISTYEKELLALVMTVKKWHPYHLGNTFIIHTDHHTLK